MAFSTTMFYENITNIYYGCRSQNNKLNSCMPKTKSVLFKAERLHETFQMDYSFILKQDEWSTTQEAEWMEIRPKYKWKLNQA